MKKSKLSIVSAAISLLVFVAVIDGPAIAASNQQGSANGKPFQDLQYQIDVLTIDLADAVDLLQDQIDTLVIEQADQDSLITALQSAVGTLEMRVSANESDIALLQAIQNMQSQLIDALDTRVTELETRVAVNEADIAGLVLVDQALQEMIMAIENQITTINSRISANDGDISALQNQVLQLQLDLGTVQASLAAKQDRVNGICPVGSAIRQISSNGSVTCEVDSVSAGVGTLQTFRSSDSVSIPSSIFVVRTVTNNRACTGSNYRAVGGGYSVNGGTLGFGNAYRNYPTSNSNWQVRVRADSVGSRSLTTYVVCARVQ